MDTESNPAPAPAYFLTKKQLKKIENLAKTAPWQKLDVLLDHGSKSVGKAFEDPILLMKLLVLQELFNVNVQQLRASLGQHYSLFVFFIPGMENGMPKASEIERLKTLLWELNLLHPFISECVDVIGLDRSKIDFYIYYCDKDEKPLNICSDSVSQKFKATGFLPTLACPRCNRRKVREGEQTLLKKIFTVRKAYICNSCTLHFDL